MVKAHSNSSNISIIIIIISNISISSNKKLLATKSILQYL